MKPRLLAVAFYLVSLCTLPAALAEVAAPAAPEMAQPWQVTQWINSAPLELAELRGEAVLVRWWTAPYCPYCSASAPALNRWHQRYRDQGLRVIGFYHHKVAEPLQPHAVAGYAELLGFEFPVAIDPQWRTLRRWWLQPNPGSRWTSVTFLIDREGYIRYVHPGGKYQMGSEEHAALEAAIEYWLAQPAGQG